MLLVVKHVIFLMTVGRGRGEKEILLKICNLTTKHTSNF